MTANTTTTWIRRVAAGAALAVAPALIALGTAAASQAETSSTSPSYSPTLHSVQVPWPQSNWHHWHQDEVQSWYR